jgi:hypothetical protein
MAARAKKKQSGRGGAREGAGRPTELGEPMSRVQVTLDNRTVETFRRFGQGNVSAGIREAARIIREGRAHAGRKARSSNNSWDRQRACIAAAERRGGS